MDYDDRTPEVWGKLIGNGMMFFLEIADVLWCFDLREIVFFNYKEDGQDFLDESLRDYGTEEVINNHVQIDMNSDLY